MVISAFIGEAMLRARCNAMAEFPMWRAPEKFLGVPAWDSLQSVDWRISLGRFCSIISLKRTDDPLFNYAPVGEERITPGL